MKVLLFVAIAILSLNRVALADDVRTIPKTIIVTNNGEVEASGRWVIINRLNSTAPLLAQLNSVEIVCNKAQSICREVTAALYTKEDAPQLSGQFLTASFSEYKITRWDASGVTAISAKPVADIEIQIDLKAGTSRRRYQETKARGSQTANPNLVVVWELK